MADLPQDQPKPVRDGSLPAVRPSEIGARDVLAYLRDHPGFLDRHPEALRLMRTPSRQRGDGVLDFQHFMLERLRRDSLRLQRELANLVTTSRGNLAGQARVHKAALALLRASGLEQLLQIVTTDLAVLIDVDVVTLGIESTTASTMRLPVPGIHLLRSGMVDALLGNEREALLASGIYGDPALFGAAAGLVRSHALLRLSFGRAAPVGLMCIGTRNPETFCPGLGTELLTFLARIFEIAISQWLQRGR